MFPHVPVALLYVLSMHTLNRLLGTRADRYNDPDRAAFYGAHRVALTVLAIAGGAAGLMAAFTAGWLPFATLLAMSITGLSYNLKVIPFRSRGGPFLRLRDIPGSKTVLIALAWGAVTTLVPALSTSGGIGADTLLVLAWTTGLVFVRTAFFDILDVQGDRIVGQETIPILIGEKRSMRLLKATLGVLAALQVLAASWGILSPLGLALVVCPLSIGVVLTAQERGWVHAGTRLEFLVETHFVLAGLIALAEAIFD
jgi:4-hydroxy-3-methylbut-2-enyl diphosphate reductase